MKNLRLKSVNWFFVGKISIHVVLISTGLFLTISLFVPSLLTVTEFGLDWYSVFRPAIISEDPYTNPNFFSPPWVIIFLAPFRLLPPGVDMIILLSCSLLVWIFVMRHLGASLLVMVLMLMTPQLWWSIIYGNIDFFVPIGLLLPPPIGLFFVLSKPQLGIGIAIYWIIESYRMGGWRQTIFTITPILIVSIIFCIPFGFWPLQLLKATDLKWNISPFPYLLGIGLVLLTRAIQNRKPGLALASTPFYTPYIASWSLPVSILGLLPSQLNTIVAILSLWAAWLTRGFA